jgi:serine protease AprX
MDHILKVFVTGDDQERLPNVKRVVERYDGFVLVEVPESAVEEIGRNYLIQDITPLYTIETRSRRINTSRPRIDKDGVLRPHSAYKDEKRLAPGPHHYLVQFVGPIKDKWLAGVRRAGGKLRAPYGDFTYVVLAEPDVIKKIASLPFVRWSGRYIPRDRVAPSVFKFAGRKLGDTRGDLPRTKVRPGVYTVEFFGPEEAKASVPGVKKLGFDVLTEDAGAGLLVVKTDRVGKPNVTAQIEALANIHGVRAIHERPIKRTSNDVAAGIMKTSEALGSSGLGLGGGGELIAVCDTGLDSGDPASIHPDFKGRVALIKSYPINSDYDGDVTNPGGDDGPSDIDSGHGTHVAGSVLGSGASSAGFAGLAGPVRGLAYKAKILFQAVEQEMKWKDPVFIDKYGRYILSGIPSDLKDLFSYAYSNGARIHSNSWGGGEAGAYDEQCRQLDAFVWDKRDFCVVVAAGNDGKDSDHDGVIDPMSVSSPGTAKNCITVGACENDRPNFTDTYGEDWPDDYTVPPISTDKVADNPNQVVAFSSRGPTKDGRAKPEVVAPGTYVLSTRSRYIAENHFGWGKFPPSKLYMYDSGTSMATPLTAGAVAVVREYLRTKQQIKSPSAALLKAALIAGATRLPGVALQGAVLDNDQGFGRVNVDAVVSPTAPAKMVFVDEPTSLKTGQVHTVSLTLKSGSAPLVVVLAYSDFPGKALVNDLNLIVRGPNGVTVVGNQAPGAPASLDANNNVEVVRIAAPAPGAYTIQVVASNVAKGPQTFALVYAGHL